MRNVIDQGGTCELKRILDARVPFAEVAGSTHLYHSADIPELNKDALAYFGASLFWRSSVWPSRKDDGGVRLGVFEEDFRLYLTGEAAFPNDAALSVVVRMKSNVSELTFMPYRGEDNGENMDVYLVAMPRLCFTLFVGRNLPDNVRNLCFVRGEGNPIVVSAKLEPLLLEKAVRLLQSSPI